MNPCKSITPIGILLLLSVTIAAAQDAKPIVQQAVQTELEANHNDHTRWLFYEEDRKPKDDLKQWVAQTAQGDLRRVLEKNGQKLSPEQQKKDVDSFLHDSSTQAKQRKAGAHDDAQAEELLKLLPDAFLWSRTKDEDGQTTLHFKPNSSFHPPDREARVFSAMEGDMVVHDSQHRIVSLKGHLMRDIKFGGGFLATLRAGGTFDVERRPTGPSSGTTEWQITETHVHIDGHALLFKSISEQEDDVKTQFRQLPGNATPEQAEKELFQADRAKQ
jgi:hypothetical protein